MQCPSLKARNIRDTAKKLPMVRLPIRSHCHTAVPLVVAMQPREQADLILSGLRCEQFVYSSILFNCMKNCKEHHSPKKKLHPNPFFFFLLFVSFKFSKHPPNHYEMATRLSRLDDYCISLKTTKSTHSNNHGNKKGRK